MEFHLETSTMFILLLILSKTQSVSKGCLISVSDLSLDKPLILKLNASQGYEAFYFPNNKDIIMFSERQDVKLACPGSKVMSGTFPFKSEFVKAKCKSGKFQIGRKHYRFTSIKCQKQPRHTARFTGTNCLQKYKEIEIGFVVQKTFLRQIIICFNKESQLTIYSQFNVSKTLVYSHAVYNRPQWIQSHFYNLSGNSLNKLYTKKNHRLTINKLLGLEYTSQKYISDKGAMYLARGHLAAKADFLYGPQQHTTFYLINAAPQWQSFNGGNWMRLETDIRTYANQNGADLIVYTGTYGIATLPHEYTGKDIELYIYVEGSKKYVPVPRLFWKVMYEPKSKKAAAFIGVNNPYVFNKSKDIICENICDKYTWLTWKPEMIVRGYSYCCSLVEFRKAVQFPMFTWTTPSVSGRMKCGDEIYWQLFPVFLFIRM